MKTSEILELYEMELGTATKAQVQQVLRLADDGGTLQAEGAMTLFSDPRNHTAMTLPTALKLFGCKEIGWLA